MTITAIWRHAASLFAAGAVAVVLSGCVLTSTTNLIAPGETVEALPASFELMLYNGNDTGDTFTASEDPPSTFTLKDGGYVAPDGSLTAYFVPLDADEGEYIIAAISTDGAMYGVATLDDAGIMDIRMIFTEDPAAAIAAAKVPGVTAADGGVVVADRPALDAMIGLVADGTVKTGPFLAYVGPGTPPKTIVKDGDWYKAQ